MTFDGATVLDLEDDVLGNIFSHFGPKDRVDTLSLVCKQWRRVERERPHRPQQLQLQPKNLTGPFMEWHLRDASRLQGVDLTCSEHGGWTDGISGRLLAVDSGWTPKLLIHLATKAPRLHTLALTSPLAQTLCDPKALPCPWLLPLVAGLTQLRRLTLTRWAWTIDALAAITTLTGLVNLRELELSMWDCAAKRYPKAYFEWGAQQLEEAVLGLHLTSLKIASVDLTAKGGFTLMPAPSSGRSLANLRHLSFRSCQFEEQCCFPPLHGLVNLTSLEVATLANNWPLVGLNCLDSLKELSIAATLQPLALSPAAALTKLSIDGCVDDEMPLSRVVPLETLRHVRELSIHCYTHRHGEPEWPATWGQATSVTRLVVNGQLEFGHPLPMFLADMQGLREVKITVRYDVFSETGQGYVLFLMKCLPGLSTLRINVWGVRAADRCFPLRKCWRIRLHKSDGRWGWGAAKWINRLCKRVCRSVPGLVHTMTIMNGWSDIPMEVSMLVAGDCSIVFSQSLK